MPLTTLDTPRKTLPRKGVFHLPQRYLRNVATRALPIVVRLIVLGLPCWVSRAGFQISSRYRTASAVAVTNGGDGERRRAKKVDRRSCSMSRSMEASPQRQSGENIIAISLYRVAQSPTEPHRASRSPIEPHRAPQSFTEPYRAAQS